MKPDKSVGTGHFDNQPTSHVCKGMAFRALFIMLPNTPNDAAPDTATFCIRGADWVLAWDPVGSRHVYLRRADVAFRRDRIIHVGGRFPGHVDREIDGSNRLVMPGLIDVHGHPTNQLIGRGIMEEIGNPDLFNTPLYDFLPLWQTDDVGLLASAEAAYAELVTSGVTTFVDYARPAPTNWVELMARSGLRIYAAPSFRDAAWRVRGREVEYVWDEEHGRRSFETALDLVDAALTHPCGRLGGVIAPAHADTCTETTLKRSWDIARERSLMWQPHAAQTLVEFHGTVRRHGKTPVQRLADIGVLGDHTTLAHCVFVDSHSRTPSRTRHDVPILAAHGVTVAHCPVAFSRIGYCLETLASYRDAGVRLALGTDTQPQNMLEEMRSALVASHVAGGSIGEVSTSDVIDMATTGGARALMRDDIGRLAPGAKADVVVVDLTHPQMRPVRDPMRSLIFSAADRAVRDVFVDGRQVVADGKVLTLDPDGALDRLQAAQDAAEKVVSQRDPRGRSGWEVSPLSFSVLEADATHFVSG